MDNRTRKKKKCDKRLKEEWLVQKFDHELRWLERFDLVQAEPPFLDLFIRQEGKWRLDLLTGFYKGPVIIYRLGEGGGLGLNKVIPPFNVTSRKWSPLITFDDFRDPLPMSSFSKQIWVVPLLNPSKVFSDSPFRVLSYDWFPLLFF